jgi:hypothetical protein
MRSKNQLIPGLYESLDGADGSPRIAAAVEFRDIEYFV